MGVANLTERVVEAIEAIECLNCTHPYGEHDRRKHAGIWCRADCTCPGFGGPPGFSPARALLHDIQLNKTGKR
jgi:hypothetical protein